ncbi:hypothetical protein HHK36_014799 [Tetracentron sinense]|uniref:Uncharacterized protein n=1 Tax=Tetracentron sinense TaxID=13715 RepID=A0A834Y7K1_TETSI|nr:hypothetical protein HHK36_032742 [Tetracentron sinense]KAF8398934.1 hypothetical protein HHK36_014799 [Tetracentron sinense]
MDGERTKRSAIEIEAEEEEKIETFFALIKSIHDIRNQLRDELCESKEKKKEKEHKSVWTPSFQWEDFFQDAQCRSTFVAGPSKSEEHGRIEREKEDDLDLKLSL